MTNQFVDLIRVGTVKIESELRQLLLLVIFVCFSLMVTGAFFYALLIDWNNSKECRESLQPGYECVKVYVQVPKDQP